MRALVLILSLLSAAPGLGQMYFELQPSMAAVLHRVERSDAPGQWRQVEELRTPSGRLSSFIDMGAPTTARYRVTAVDVAGNLTGPLDVPPWSWDCAWRGKGFSVPVVCAAPCDCATAVARLSAAKEQLERYRLAEPAELAKTLAVLSVITVSQAKKIDVPGVGLARGVFDGGAGSVHLTGDLHAALHEMLHAHQVRLGLADESPPTHTEWERDGLLREVDLRFQERYRGRPAWIPNSR